MDRFVRLFHGGVVKENGELENMKEVVVNYGRSPSYVDLVAHARKVLGCLVGRGEELRLRGRVDCGKARAHYVMMTIESASDWNTYKDAVKESNVKCLEVVGEVRTMADFVRVKKEAVEGLLKLEEDACDVKRQLIRDCDSVKEGQDQLHCRSSQDSLDAQSFKHFDVCDNFDLAIASDRLDGASLREMGDQDDGEISLGSKDEEEESDEDGSGQSEEEEFASEEEEGSEEDGEGEVSLEGDDEEEGSEEDGNGDSQQEDEEEYDRGVSDNYYDQEDIGGSGTRGAVEVLYGHHSNLNEEQGGGDEEGRGRRGGHYNEEEGGGDGHHSEDGESRENDEEESGGDEEDGARESGHYNEEERGAGGHNCEDDESLEDDRPLEDGRGGDRRMLMVVHAQQGSWAQVREDDRTMLQEHGVEIPQVHFHDDVSGAYLARCDTGLATIREGSARDRIIREGLRFETLEKVQFFLARLCEFDITGHTR
ncbi:hypothetical protein U9M48_002203 [Paspalum notatum var. saurae]|uniref:Uncharacterized protein n=1 Tax=Paspalum notatum var. saurae TaxID=547442 RepID=A0AAQ3PJE6_PASNO